MSLFSMWAAPLFGFLDGMNFSSLAGAVSIAVFWGAIVLIVAIPAYLHHQHKTRVAELNAAVKQQMIDRGYSVEEILAVVNENAKLLKSGGTPVSKMAPSKVPLHSTPASGNS